MNPRVVWTVARTTFREFWRTPEALFWTYGFPLLMAIVLGFAFQPAPPAPLPVAVLAEASAELQAALVASSRLQVEVVPAPAADAALARGRVAIVVGGSLAEPVLRADPTRPEAETARLLVERALRERRDGPGTVNARFVAEERPGSRYIDFLIPGLVGLNLLGAGMWSIGFTLVMMRSQHLLRRLLVTPIRRSEFLLGYLAGRFVLVVPESLAILAFGCLVQGVPFRGSLLAAALLVLVGGLAFAGLGLLVASRAKTMEGVAGLMNVCQLPMWLIGGSFFANERFEGWLRWCADALPLTQFNRGLRDVMLEPGGFGAVAVPLLFLAGFAVVCFAVALRIFRWN